MSQKIIDKIWQSYKRSVIPADAGRVQIEETHKAFIAGASAMFDTIATIGSNDSITEEAGFLLLESIDAEMMETVKLFTGESLPS